MLSDLKFSLRQLRRAPGFTAIAILTLALGLGATTLTFSLVNAVLLRPLPVENPASLVTLNETNAKRNFSSDLSISYSNYVDWRRDNQTLANSAVYEDASFTLAEGAGAEHLSGAVASAGFFPTLGVPPSLGRTFLPEEESPAGARVVVLSHEIWANRFKSDPQVLGRTARLNGVAHTIIGVMPDNFRFPDDARLWTPIRDAVSDDSRGSHDYSGIGRLKPGSSLEQVELDLNLIADRLSRAHPATNANVSVVVRPLTKAMTANYRQIVLSLFGAVACLLLITCVNLASLLLARGAAREREIAVRMALGAGRGRIISQLLTENLLLGVAGGAFGILLAGWGLDLLTSAMGDNIPWWIHLNLDRTVLGFAFILSITASLGFGLVPSWLLSRAEVGAALKQGGRSGSGVRSGLMRLLVGAQLALAVVLLTGAGLLVKSFAHLQNVQPGFDPRGVLTFSLTLPDATYPDAASQITANERLVARLQVIPGVESVAVVSNLPLGGSNWGRGFTLADRPAPSPGQTPVALNRVVSTDYFRTMHIALRQGRLFSDGDIKTAPKVALIDETFAKQFFDGRNPVGQRLHYGRAGRENPEWIEIVGVVGDVRHYDLQNSKNGPGLYVSAAQYSPTTNAFYVLRTAGEPAALTGSVRKAVEEFDHELAPDAVQSMNRLLGDSVWRDRLTEEIFAGFAGLALLLSALGVYGVTAFATSQRTREFGVRMALGAQPADVRRLVLSGGLRLALVALALGVAAAFALTRLIATQLYEVDPRDPAIFAGVTFLLAAVALAACWLPARRATQVDPLIALRAE